MVNHINIKVPQIRFQGFAANWVEMEFKHLASRSSQSSTEDAYPRIEYEDIVSGSGLLNKNVFLKKSHKGGIKFSKGDVLFGKLRPYLKNLLLAEFDGIAVGDFWVLSADTPTFLYHLIQTEAFDRVANQSAGSKMPRSDWNLVSNSIFHAPSDVVEQEKIGEYFRELDSLIGLHQRKHDKLVTLKKAMLQKMFPQAGATTPQIRFKGFKGDWVNKKFGDLFSYERPDPYIVKSSEYSNENITPVLTANKAFILGYTNETRTFNKPCIVFDDFTLEAKFANFPFMVKSSAIKILTIQNAEINDLYFGFLTLRNSKIEILGHARHYIEVVQPTPVRMPELPEQQKISSYFRTLDELISKHATQLQKLKQIKAACLEKMFV